jgi:hypothetical protein
VDNSGRAKAAREGLAIRQIAVLSIPAPGLTYVKSTSINLMAGIPSYFSGSNPYLSNLRLAALSTCDLNRSKFSRAPCKSRTFVG